MQEVQYEKFVGKIIEAEYVYDVEYGFALLLTTTVQGEPDRQCGVRLTSMVVINKLASNAGMEEETGYVEPQIFIGKDCEVHTFADESRYIRILRTVPKT